MKIFSWKIWVPTMVICMIGFGLTGPAMKQQVKSRAQIEILKEEAYKSHSRLKADGEKSGKSPKMYEYDMKKPEPVVPPPPPPAPVPKQSSALSDILLYGSIASAGVNAINFSKSIINGLIKLINWLRGLWK